MSLLEKQFGLIVLVCYLLTATCQAAHNPHLMGAKHAASGWPSEQALEAAPALALADQSASGAPTAPRKPAEPDNLERLLLAMALKLRDTCQSLQAAPTTTTTTTTTITSKAKRGQLIGATKTMEDVVLRKRLNKIFNDLIDTAYLAANGRKSSTVAKLAGAGDEAGEQPRLNSLQQLEALAGREAAGASQQAPQPAAGVNMAEHQRRVLEDGFGIRRESMFTTNNHLGSKGVPKFGSEEEY